MLYTVYNTYNHQVGLGVHPRATPSEDNIRLAHAPSNPRDFKELALHLAEILKTAAEAGPGDRHLEANGNGNKAGAPPVAKSEPTA